ncbi:MAG: hypothetical protein AAFV88_00300 [Planctomycetota bacterium]
MASSTAFTSDPDAYRAIAITIASENVFGLLGEAGTPRSTAFRPPLYPWLLSFCTSGNALAFLRVAFLHVALAAVMSSATFLGARRLLAELSPGRLPDRLAALAAGLAVLDPILIRQSTELMTETLAATLAAIVIVLWTSLPGCSMKMRSAANSLAIGVTLALAYLCRPTFLVWAVLMVFAILVIHWSRKRFVAGASFAMLMALPVALAVTAWTIRNDRAIGHPVWATTHGGYTLLLANNDLFYDYLDSGSWGEPWQADAFFLAHAHRYNGDPREAAFWRQDWTGVEATAQSIDEYGDDRLCYDAAKATIKRRPTEFVWSCVVRVARLWSPFPHQVRGRSQVAMVAVGGFYLAVSIAVMVAIVRWNRRLLMRKWWAIGMLVFTLSGVHAVYWSNLRMRAPAIPGLMILAVASCLPKSATTAESGSVRA